MPSWHSFVAAANSLRAGFRAVVLDAVTFCVEMDMGEHRVLDLVLNQGSSSAKHQRLRIFVQKNGGYATSWPCFPFSVWWESDAGLLSAITIRELQELPEQSIGRRNVGKAIFPLFLQSS